MHTDEHGFFLEVGADFVSALRLRTTLLVASRVPHEDHEKLCAGFAPNPTVSIRSKIKNENLQTPNHANTKSNRNPGRESTFRKIRANP